METYKRLVELAKKRLALLNEGFPTICCGIVLLHIVDHLHRQEEEKYQLIIYPVVKTFIDRRKNKRSDYVLIRLMNKRSVIVFEIKLSVGSVISACKESLETMICVLADHANWHILVIDLRQPFSISEYFYLHQPKIEILCSLIKKTHN